MNMLISVFNGYCCLYDYLFRSVGQMRTSPVGREISQLTVNNRQLAKSRVRDLYLGPNCFRSRSMFDPGYRGY
jgi:hypothetical protein